MQRLFSHDWLWIASGVALYAAAGLLLVWALLWDRSRGRRRCPRCCYDMAGTPGLVCPECGRVARNERALHRTHRRWRAVPIGLVLAASAWGCTAVPTVMAHGWRRIVPTTVLILVAPVDKSAWSWSPSIFGGRPFASPVDKNLVELYERGGRGELRAWQRRAVLDRFFEANPEQLGSVIQARSQWPRGVPVEVYRSAPIAFLKGQDLVVRARIRGTGRPWTESPAAWRYGSPNRGRMTLGPPPDGADRFEIETEILVGARPITSSEGEAIDTSRARRIWHGVAATCTVAPSVEEVMAPVRSDAANRAVERHIVPDLLIDRRTGAVGPTMVAADTHIDPTGGDWALGLHIQVLREGRVVAESRFLDRLLPPTVTLSVNRRSDYSGMKLTWHEQPPAQTQLDAEVWELVLRGDPEIALMDFGRSTYWSGTIRRRITWISPER